MTLYTIDVDQAQKWHENDEVYLVDVREPAEYRSEYIEGSVNIPFSLFDCEFVYNKYISESDSPRKKLLLTCTQGPRALDICKRLHKLDGTKHYYMLGGGIDKWVRSGHKTIRTHWMLSIDRQVRLVVGITIVVTLLLGIYVSDVFFLVTGLMGCGFVFAGLTGACGMAKILSVLPWNR